MQIFKKGICLYCGHSIFKYPLINLWFHSGIDVSVSSMYNLSKHRAVPVKEAPPTTP